MSMRRPRPAGVSCVPPARSAGGLSGSDLIVGAAGNPDRRRCPSPCRDVKRRPASPPMSRATTGMPRPARICLHRVAGSSGRCCIAAPVWNMLAPPTTFAVSRPARLAAEQPLEVGDQGGDRGVGVLARVVGRPPRVGQDDVRHAAEPGRAVVEHHPRARAEQGPDLRRRGRHRPPADAGPRSTLRAVSLGSGAHDRSLCVPSVGVAGRAARRGQRVQRLAARARTAATSRAPAPSVVNRLLDHEQAVGLRWPGPSGRTRAGSRRTRGGTSAATARATAASAAGRGRGSGRWAASELRYAQPTMFAVSFAADCSSSPHAGRRPDRLAEQEVGQGAARRGPRRPGGAGPSEPAGQLHRAGRDQRRRPARAARRPPPGRPRRPR